MIMRRTGGPRRRPATPRGSESSVERGRGRSAHRPIASIGRSSISMSNVPARTALVLGGGGLKGFVHIGVIRALEERGIRPSVIAGTSIGALIGAAYAGGMSVSEMEARAVSLRRRDLFRINHVGMLF